MFFLSLVCIAYVIMKAINKKQNKTINTTVGTSSRGRPTAAAETPDTLVVVYTTYCARTGGTVSRISFKSSKRKRQWNSKSFEGVEMKKRWKLFAIKNCITFQHFEDLFAHQQMQETGT